MEHLSLDQQILRTMPIFYLLLSSRSPQRMRYCVNGCVCWEMYAAPGEVSNRQVWRTLAGTRLSTSFEYKYAPISHSSFKCLLKVIFELTVSPMQVPHNF